MRRLVVLLALAAAAAAAAVQCPEGWTELTEADEGTTVAASGLTILQAGWQQWGLNAKEQWCDELPEVINEAGRDYYNVTLVPECKGPDAQFRFLVESNNPCEGGQPFVGFMSTTTNSSDCERSWVETGGYDVEVKASANVEGVQPLQCATGYRAATEEELDGKATQLLWQTLIFPTFSQQTKGQFDEAWYCDDSPGYKSIEITNVTACVADDPEADPQYMRTQGVVTWVCAQQARRRTVALTVNADYEMSCTWTADIQMGSEPGVPPASDEE
ncbi:TNA1 High affinity nicotinic acid plasma membrane permease [Chlorella sorokiniana]|uniref:TNA1 High affinity nicotinic acid plasma membrane permease n=1 Tax=Chlorella sorokiniana TaxID=3076 RepID=A0A2P6TFY6_CHLSO|nr:TNA1 High affinity nicotinic acid plasma membrane permease [Chlorella sorokiniana]|eukprot:PRW33026.1 TNA1 High affinity nicotinic acid plasma membrane permease [Chlorella sorokiniana]